MWTLFLSTIVVALGWCVALVLVVSTVFLTFGAWSMWDDARQEREMEAWRQAQRDRSADQ